MQLRLIYGVLFCLIVFCCKRQEQKEIRYYPSQELYDESKLINLDLDTTSLKFMEITSKIDKVLKENKRILIELDDNEIHRRIIPLTFSEIRKRDVLSLTSDSILIDNGYSISELKPILKRHYTNNGKDFHYPRSYQRAIVEITIDTSKKGKDLKKTLLYLTKTFDEINLEVKDTLKLQIIFNYIRQIPPPPSPPPNISE